jgi:hypothetical protein
MPGFLLTLASQVNCSHPPGKATPASVSTRVTIMGQGVATKSSSYAVAGCTMPAPPNGNGPCATALFSTNATRITTMGIPVLLQDSQATCVPTGTPLVVAGTQSRVSGV